MSPRDQLENVSYGNDAVDTWSHGPANGQMSAMVSSVPGLPDKLADLAYQYDGFGNLKLQTNQLLDAEEVFNYDQLQRLIGRIIKPIPEITPIDPPIAGPSGPSAPVLPDPQPKPFEIPEGVDYQYDALGNITRKSDYASNYEYLNSFYPEACPFGINGATPPGPHAVTQVSAQIRSRFGGTSTQNNRIPVSDGAMILSHSSSLNERVSSFSISGRLDGLLGVDSTPLARLLQHGIEHL